MKKLEELEVRSRNKVR